MSIGTGERVAGPSATWQASQLPFGFDVDWYHKSAQDRGIAGQACLNCLSALMSIGTRFVGRGPETAYVVSIAFRL